MYNVRASDSALRRRVHAHARSYASWLNFLSALLVSYNYIYIGICVSLISCEENGGQ